MLETTTLLPVGRFFQERDELFFGHDLLHRTLTPARLLRLVVTVGETVAQVRPVV